MFCLYELATGNVTQVTTVHPSLPDRLPSGVGLLVLDRDEWEGHERTLIECYRVADGELRHRGVSQDLGRPQQGMT